jgi:hypothetical protein
MLAPEKVPDPVSHPILETLNKSFWNLKTAFYSLGKNFFASMIGANPRLIKKQTRPGIYRCNGSFAGFR